MAEMMNVAMKVKPEYNGTEIKKIPVTRISADEVLIKVNRASICGTDLHIYSWNDWASKYMKLPVVYGHEFSGYVEEIGSNVKTVKKGDYVSGEGHVWCDNCYICHINERHICKNLRSLGVNINGAFSEYVAIREKNVWHNDPAISPSIASLQDPLGNAVQTVFAGDVSTKTVLVTGCGPIGLMAINIAKALGAEKIIATEHNNEYRLALAKELGADYTFQDSEDVYSRIHEITNGYGVDVVLEFSGALPALKLGLSVLRNGGKMVMLGIFNESNSLPMSIVNDVVLRAIKIEGITGRRVWETWHQSNALLKSGKMQMDKIITHEFKFEDFHEAFKIAFSGKAGKVVLKFD